MAKVGSQKSVRVSSLKTGDTILSQKGQSNTTRMEHKSKKGEEWRRNYNANKPAYKTAAKNADDE